MKTPDSRSRKIDGSTTTTMTPLERINAHYDLAADTLVSLGFTRLRRRAGDIFRLRRISLEVQLTRPIGEFEWQLREVGTMRPFEWFEIREAARN